MPKHVLKLVDSDEMLSFFVIAAGQSIEQFCSFFFYMQALTSIMTIKKLQCFTTLQLIIKKEIYLGSNAFLIFWLRSCK
jgi:hypothetical protein